MAFYRCGGGGIPSSLKTDMNAVFNKKFGTAVDYPPEGWPDDVNLMGPLPEKTIVSSPIADFSDGADDVPTKSLVVTIPPTLTGVSSVTETQTGRNLFDKDNANVVNGYIDVSAFNTGNANAKTIYILIKGGLTYTVSKTVGARFSIATSDVIPTNGATYTSKQAGNTSASLTITAGANDTYLWAWIYLNGTDTGTLEDMLASVQIEYGSTAHAYEPYQTPTTYTANRGRTIYGGEVDIVNGVGKDTYGYIVFDGDENWGAYPSYNGYYIGISDMKSGTRQDGVCNQLTCSKSNAQGQTDAFWLGVGNSRFYVIGVYDSMGNTLEAFKAYLAENPLILVYPLATPTDFTFDGQEIPTRLGYNAFWSDSGDTEVTYRADINLALGGQ